VLVVDDEPAVRAIVVELLKVEGYETAEAGDGQAALDAVAADPPDAVVTDLWMPRLSGQDLIHRLRAAGSGVPVVAMSAWKDQPLVPGVPFVPKPLHLERLLAALDEVLWPAPEPARAPRARWPLPWKRRPS